MQSSESEYPLYENDQQGLKEERDLLSRRKLELYQPKRQPIILDNATRTRLARKVLNLETHNTLGDKPEERQYRLIQIRVIRGLLGISGSSQW